MDLTFFIAHFILLSMQCFVSLISLKLCTLRGVCQEGGSAVGLGLFLPFIFIVINSMEWPLLLTGVHIARFCTSSCGLLSTMALVISPLTRSINNFHISLRVYKSHFSCTSVWNTPINVVFHDYHTSRSLYNIYSYYLFQYITAVPPSWSSCQKPETILYYSCLGLALLRIKIVHAEVITLLNWSNLKPS